MSSPPTADGATVAAQVHRYLVLGQEGTCFTASVKPVPLKGLQFVEQLVSEGRGAEVVSELQRLCVDNHGAGLDDAHIHVLAACARSGDDATRQAAYAALPAICRTGQELLTFVHFAEQLSKLRGGGTGWGRAQRKALIAWYNDLKPMEMLIVCTRCPSRHGWSHQDVLKLGHVRLANPDSAVVIKYLFKGLAETLKVFDVDGATPEVTEMLNYMKALDKLKHTEDEQEASSLLTSHNFEWEQTPTRLRKQLWPTIFPRMTLRNHLLHLRRFAQLGYLAPNHDLLPVVLEQLRDKEQISASRIQPMEVFVAMQKYEDLGVAKVTVPIRPKRRLTPSVIDALHNLFVSSLHNVPATGKRFLIAVDVRNPMVHGRVQGSQHFTPALASALIILPLLFAEESVTVTAFSMNSMHELDLKKDMSLLDITKCMRETPMGPIDCAQPMLWARQNNKPFDVFLILTDNQVKSVAVKPSDALQQYREALNIPQARLIVTALSLRRFNVAYPDDPGMLDIGGFNLHVPRVISNFVLTPH